MSNHPGRVAAASSGCYEASRAAALSGVPRSTVYDWARKDIVVPSISPVQEKLWSYADLMALRLVAWLRRPKERGEDGRLPANPMSQVRSALALLDQWDLPVWTEEAEAESPIVVDQRGAIFLNRRGEYFDVQGNQALPHEERFGLLSPFEIGDMHGPDLRKPRPDIRIVPARVAGEPHVVHSRITTVTLSALVQRGLSMSRIALMYSIEPEVVNQAADLERALASA